MRLWIFKAVAYFLRLNRDEKFLGALNGIYAENVATKKGIFVKRNISISLIILIIAYIFTFDFRFEAVNVFPDFISPLFMKNAVPFDFSIPTLKELRKNYKTGLITNGKHELQAKKIEMLGMEDLFDEVMISDDFGVRKPDTKLYAIMAEKLGIEPGEMLYVGDHPKNDIDASRNAGYIPVWVKTTGTWIYPDIEKPELQVDTVAELPELLKNI